jgi:hypothetical protein
MKYLVCIVFLLFTVSEMGAQDTTTAATFDINAAERFANLALACFHKQYPNKLSHTLNSDADVAPPRKLTPRVLRLLRLAFLGARALASRTVSQDFFRRLLRATCT